MIPAEANPVVGRPGSDEAAAALAWHDGDAVATIITLINDCWHLRVQLTLAEAAMSKGFSRGWAPAYDRED